jgi:glycosyltransferase involved in cell wall biosynthesis
VSAELPAAAEVAPAAPPARRTRVALVTTPPAVFSGIGDYTRHLLPYLREHCEVELFVDPAQRDRSWPGEERVRGADELAPREFDQIVYQLGNERAHAFMAPLVRALGGTVVQHDWVLFDLALTAFPALARGGLKGHALALREGGLQAARVYARNWRERRHARLRPAPVPEVAGLDGALLAGWHEPEPEGRWTADRAFVRLPARGIEEVELELHADPGRSVTVLEGVRVLASGTGELRFRPEQKDEPALCIATEGIRVGPEQRRHGDARRLGVFVRRIAWRGESSGELDLAGPCALREVPVTLSRDRFLLPLNRSIVRFADAFVAHSEYVKRRILAERNAPTPVAVVHHGSERRWRDEERRATRARLGLAGPWLDAFLVTSFGGVQPHKRVDQALRALARARSERADLRLVLAGSLSGDFDARALARSLGIEEAVHFTGFVPEELGWEWLHAGDVALNLRGPTSGGTSGGIFQAFSMGRPVIASDAAEQQELPDACVVKVPLGAGEVESLARVLVSLRDDPARRRALEAAVRRFVDEHCHWSIVAQRYAACLASFPHARSARKRLIAAARAREPRTR